ncbi:lipase maturation factor 2 isoform X2 [Aplysia californica]|uniref:Lipase maturation factor n=1 Tax=Aplysia californica TaxID=6500 RepID=A0ABM1A403_APLCA|nr:lipase maturation factor 2 isoform X2 [Aplysia californica]
MGSLYRTRDCFLWFMSLVYLFAFTSLYIQIPGLYGDNGILPAKLVLKTDVDSWQDLMEGQPTLLKLMPRFGLDVQTGMDLLCFAGMVVSFFCVVSRTARDFVSFTLLWMFYLSLYQVGQTFMWFQWDILLLEAGFLTIIIAPFNLQLLGRKRPVGNPHDSITMWLARWLLFRLMFASGVVKLTSQCPTWWGLTALNVHFESQCIPTPAAWYWHQFPEWLLKLSVVATYVIEIPVPFLFFSPVRSLRIFAFWSQVLLQMMIIVTGNYNFFNLLTITLCISLLDDSFCMFSQPKYKKVSSKKKSVAWSGLSGVANYLFPLVVLGYIGYQTVLLFNIKLNPDFTVHSKIAFSEQQFTRWLETVMPYTIYLGAASLGFEVVVSLVRSVVMERGAVRKLMCLAGTVVFSLFAVFIFTVTLVPHTTVHKPTQSALPKPVLTYHSAARPFHITSSYGLFRRMTGVGGRPELIVEGHASERAATKDWKAYEFLYKPGNVSAAPPVVAPHQPRLDWQMWFAALGNYQGNSWFLNVVYRLLQNEPDVLELIAHNPFPEEPPKYIRATLYHYHYTSPKDCAGKANCAWWKREKKAEYLPALAMSDKSFQDYLKHVKLADDDAPRKFRADNWLAKAIVWLRELIGQPEGLGFTVSVFGSAILVMFLNRALF